MRSPNFHFKRRTYPDNCRDRLGFRVWGRSSFILGVGSKEQEEEEEGRVRAGAKTRAKARARAEARARARTNSTAFIHTQRGDAIHGVKLITSLVRASDYYYCACSAWRRRMEPTADRASTLRLHTSRLSRLQTMGLRSRQTKLLRHSADAFQCQLVFERLTRNEACLLYLRS